MRGKRLLALLLCMAMAFQVVPFASAEEQARNTAEPPDFSVYAPGEIDVIVDKDGKAAISPKDPAIYNGVETKAVEVANVQIAARDGWTLVPFEESFEENTARMIGVRLNGVDIDANGILDLSGQSWVIEAGGKLPLDFNVRLPESLPRKDVPGVLTITYTLDPKRSTVLFYFSFNLGNKFAGAHIQCISDFPKSFKVCLLITIFYHRQMRAGNSRKPAQNILGYSLFLAKIAYCPPNRAIVELHRLTPLSQQIVYEKTQK